MNFQIFFPSKDELDKFLAFLEANNLIIRQSVIIPEIIDIFDNEYQVTSTSFAMIKDNNFLVSFPIVDYSKLETTEKYLSDLETNGVELLKTHRVRFEEEDGRLVFLPSNLPTLCKLLTAYKLSYFRDYLKGNVVLSELIERAVSGGEFNEIYKQVNFKIYPNLPFESVHLKELNLEGEQTISPYNNIIYSLEKVIEETKKDEINSILFKDESLPDGERYVGSFSVDEVGVGSLTLKAINVSTNDVYDKHNHPETNKFFFKVLYAFLAKAKLRPGKSFSILTHFILNSVGTVIDEKTAKNGALTISLKEHKKEISGLSKAVFVAESDFLTKPLYTNFELGNLVTEKKLEKLETEFDSFVSDVSNINLILKNVFS